MDKLSFELKKPLRENLKSLDFNGTPDRIRTCGLRIRSPLLYPTELQAQIKKKIYQVFYIMSIKKKELKKINRITLNCDILYNVIGISLMIKYKVLFQIYEQNKKTKADQKRFSSACYTE
jgi:hypothetical protein